MKSGKKVVEELLSGGKCVCSLSKFLSIDGNFFQYMEISLNRWEFFQCMEEYEKCLSIDENFSC